MLKLSLNVLKYAIPLIIVLAFFSIYSGSTLYFFISFLFFLIILIIIYPVYENSFHEKEKNIQKKIYQGDQEFLEKKFEEAKNGSAVAQRIIEDRVFIASIEEISDRTGKSLNEILDSFEKNDFGIDEEVLIILKKFLERRNSLDKSVDGIEFESEILKIIRKLGE
ncbi:MAG: hypothetical protein QW649_00385 [Thermoplasmata archaeon]